ncbi:MAG: cellobiose phosphorylase [Lachnospiraceae bacterium]|nr:cellobiose phosphorylase [Lachnospiraceae bacterium]
MTKLYYTDDMGGFCMENPEGISGLYFPLAGRHALKSVVTPTYAGDAKTDQNHFLLTPKSIRNLTDDMDSRNFLLVMEDELWSATGASAAQLANRFTDKEDTLQLYGSRMKQRTVRGHKTKPLEAEVTMISLLDHPAELMRVKITNTGKEPVAFTPVAAIPVYGRSADNLRDHRHVTSMLHRASVTEYGIVLTPTLAFDERGHVPGDTTYYVYGADQDGKAPVGFLADTDSYIGEGGNFLRPASLLSMADTRWQKAGDHVDGREVTGVLRFADVTLKGGESVSFEILMGLCDTKEKIMQAFESCNTAEKAADCIKASDDYWKELIPLHVHTGSREFDRFMEWVAFQPQLRRIFGCSFLPHHDYGKGGRGWRDLWQDCLALLLTEPEGIGKLLLNNFAGVRLDGSNATIIGDAPGEFKADRNGIPRVWMDHGFWPFLTLRLYMDRTGDLEILEQNVGYFKDALSLRAESRDEGFDPGEGVFQRTQSGEAYKGSVIEHLLLQNVTAFFDLGEHGIMRLRGADWNDALDMAKERGESVAFSCAYAGNLRDIADYLQLYKEKTKAEKVSLLKELDILLSKENEALFGDVDACRKLLYNYMEAVSGRVSGEKTTWSVDEIARRLRAMSDALMERIRRQEWITQDDLGWFNSYYDNSGRSVEGMFERDGKKQVRMMLTGQVFSVMSGTATKEDTKKIIKSADAYLYDEAIGGYRLNTDFEELKTDMGRMFGFAYGEKENGAVFSHMAVMYANALYQRGFADAGYKALHTLYRASADYTKSKIYPGVPEYFNNDGRGLYHYLTGAGSWYLLTVITEMFGIRGRAGDLVLSPNLLKEQFDDSGRASVDIPFAGTDLTVVYQNVGGKEWGEYAIEKAVLDQEKTYSARDGAVLIPKADLKALGEGRHVIEVTLS